MTTELTDPKQMSDERSRRALAEFILAVADSKRLLGIRYAEWCDGAPTLEASVAASAMAQDELGHSRALLPLLHGFPEIDPGIPDEAPRTQYSALAFLEQPFFTWPTLVAANVLIGGALTVALEAARDSCYVPLRTRAVKILEEERFHWLHGEGWFRRLATDGKEAIDLANRVEDILPQVLCWFGRAEDDALTQSGILDAGSEQMRARLLDMAGPLIARSRAEHLLRMEEGHWNYAGHLPWSRFDPATRRVRPIASE